MEIFRFFQCYEIRKNLILEIKRAHLHTFSAGDQRSFQSYVYNTLSLSLVSHSSDVKYIITRFRKADKVNLVPILKN